MAQMSTEERLVYMANQIARNFAVTGADQAAAATADHIATFWDPMMKQRILTLAEHVEPGLNPITVAALKILQNHGAPPHQTAATSFVGAADTGGSDAG